MKKLFLLLTLAAFTSNFCFAQTSNPVSNATSASLGEAEAHIAINPSDSNQMAVGYMSQNPSLEFKIYYSTDAGNSWNLSSFNSLQLSNPLYPGLLVAGGGDIILAYDKTGKLYVSWIYLYYDTPADSAYFSGQWASSTDNGQSFQFENVNQSDEFFGRGVLTNGLSNIANINEGICDRQWMAVDHSNGTNANNLYVGYINYTNTFGGLRVRTKNPLNPFFNSAVNAAVGNYQLSNLAVDNNGILHYSFASTVGVNGIYHMSSSNGGATFSAPNLVSITQNSFPNGHPINDRLNAAPSLAIDGQNNLHISWTSYPTGQDPITFHSRSTDGGMNWSTPLNFNDVLNQGSFFANVSAAGNKVSVSTYGIDATKKADYYLFVSHDYGVSFDTPIKLTTQQSDFGAFSVNDFPGDYTSSIRTECKTLSVWPDLRAGGQPKLYLSSFTDCAPVGFQEFTTINSPFQISNLYPNPAINILNIDFINKSNQDVNLGIYTIDGKKISSKDYSLEKGGNTKKVDVSNLASGNYLISITDSRGNKITRMFAK